MWSVIALRFNKRYLLSRSDTRYQWQYIIDFEDFLAIAIVVERFIRWMDGWMVKLAKAIGRS